MGVGVAGGGEQVWQGRSQPSGQWSEVSNVSRKWPLGLYEYCRCSLVQLESDLTQIGSFSMSNKSLELRHNCTQNVLCSDAS